MVLHRAIKKNGDPRLELLIPFPKQVIEGDLRKSRDAVRDICKVQGFAAK
jgi:hypothetical protein